MKIHASEYKADATKMFVAGDSSGGHSAFFSQLIKEDSNETFILKQMQMLRELFQCMVH